MKRFLFPILFTCTVAHAQNTGIGTTTPTEKLDVNGNINVTGTIKTNGTDGVPGQVLSRGSGNTLQWATLNTAAAASENSQVYTATTAGAVQTFTVPAGVTAITIEAWGGGGTGGVATAAFTGATGGAGGGGGGGYIKAKFVVSPGNTVNITVGLGATSLAVASGSSVTVGVVTVTAQPGTNAQVLAGSIFSNPTGTFIGGAGGGYTITGGAAQYQFMKGAEGENPVYRVIPVGASGGNTTYTDDYLWGKGGDSGNSANTGGLGGQSTGLGLAYHLALGKTGGMPGGGGGGGRNVINAGGNGLVIIHY